MEYSALFDKTDHWLNLFGTDRAETDVVKNEKTQENIDSLFEQLEILIKDQHQKGGLTASAKSSIERYLDKITTKTNN